jgi:hypothetical protein
MKVLRQTGETWTRVSLQNFESERELQGILADAPELIPGCAGTFTVRELAVPGAGFIDLVCIDETGSLTIVECKLAGNSQSRREVVGQIFSYASGLAGMSYEDFASRFAARTTRSLQEAARAAASGALDEPAFRAGLEDALRTGRFQLVVAVDEITPELKSIIEYLNEHLSDSVALVALELGYLRVGEEKFLVPATYGAEIADRSEGPKQKAWTAEDVRAAVEALAAGAPRELVEELLDHASRHAATFKGGVGNAPSAGFYYAVDEGRPSVWSLYVRDPGPVVAVNLGSINRVSEGAADRALAALRSSPAIASKLAGVDEPRSRYPEFPLAELIAEDASVASAITEAVTTAVGVPITSTTPSTVADDEA